MNISITQKKDAKYIILFLLILFISTSACKTHKTLTTPTPPTRDTTAVVTPPLPPLITPSPPSKPEPTKEAFSAMVANSTVFEKGITGFALYDPQTRKMLATHNAEKPFVPASTTKILTLYTALCVLGDSMPALRYIERGNELLFKGTGDPSFFHPYIEAHNAVKDFFDRHKNQKLLYYPYDFQDDRYGKGWAWDDYAYYFQPEKSPFPIHSNVVSFVRNTKGQWKVFPNSFQNSLRASEKDDADLLQRAEHENIFYYDKNNTKSYLDRKLPALQSDELFLKVFNELMQTQARLATPNTAWDRAQERSVYSMPVDSVYRQLMLPSDNFVGEQLMLVCSEQLFGTQQVEKAIDWSLKNHLRDCPSALKWVDGSGLSRYNLVSPHSMVYVLEGIFSRISFQRIKNIFPVGGQSGTISNWYAANPPFVFAKTGTLSGVHCLSGYVLTKSGKILIFSFMHNNFIGSATPLKQEMDKILRAIRDGY